MDNSNNAENCYVKLKDAYGKDVFSFFVQAYSSATAAVPEGDYYVYFARGDDWYGKRYLLERIRLVPWMRPCSAFWSPGRMKAALPPDWNIR